MDYRRSTATLARLLCTKAIWSNEAKSWARTARREWPEATIIHFAMQLDGIQIDSKEWWDSHWIKDHIAKPIDLPRFSN